LLLATLELQPRPLLKRRLPLTPPLPKPLKRRPLLIRPPLIRPLLIRPLLMRLLLRLHPRPSS
jgi:hypothetical protein